MCKPCVTKKCVANSYAAPHERIVEFADGRGNGGLILRHAPRPVRQVGQVEEMIARRIAADHRAHAGEPDAGIDHVAGDADVVPDFGSCAA